MPNPLSGANSNAAANNTKQPSATDQTVHATANFYSSYANIQKNLFQGVSAGAITGFLFAPTDVILARLQLNIPVRPNIFTQSLRTMPLSLANGVLQTSGVFVLRGSFERGANQLWGPSEYNNYFAVTAASFSTTFALAPLQTLLTRLRTGDQKISATWALIPQEERSLGRWSLTMRNSAYWIGYQATYSWLRTWATKTAAHNEKNTSIVTNLSPTHLNFVLGAGAGLAGTIVSFPFNLLSQVQRHKGHGWRAAAKYLKSEGFFNSYRTLPLAAGRMVLAGAVTATVSEEAGDLFDTPQNETNVR